MVATVEDQIKHVRDCGVRIDNFEIGRLWEDFERSDYEESGKHYDCMISALQSMEECPQLWFIDLEFPPNRGDYVQLVEDLEFMTSKGLNANSITEQINAEHSGGWVEFDCYGERIHWDIAHTSGYMDSDVFGYYNKLLEQHAHPLRIYFDTENGVYALTKESMKKLQKCTTWKIRLCK